MESNVFDAKVQNPGVFWHSLQSWVRWLIMLSGLVAGVVAWFIVMSPFSPYFLFVLLGTTTVASVLKIVFGVIFAGSILIALFLVPRLWFLFLFQVLKSYIIANNGGGLAEIIFKKEG